eukprot:3416510-Rhodomonas_salina.5
MGCAVDWLREVRYCDRRCGGLIKAVLRNQYGECGGVQHRVCDAPCQLHLLVHQGSSPLLAQYSHSAGVGTRRRH